MAGTNSKAGTKRLDDQRVLSAGTIKRCHVLQLGKAASRRIRRPTCQAASRLGYEQAMVRHIEPCCRSGFTQRYVSSSSYRSIGTLVVLVDEARRMLSISHDIPIYLYTAPADMRKSFDGLTGLINQVGMGDLFHGLFVFRNRRGDRIKILYFDRDGLAIWYKRLEQGRFQWPVASPTCNSVQIDDRKLRLILDGVDLQCVKHRKRYSREKSQKSCGKPLETGQMISSHYGENHHDRTGCHNP